MNGSITNILFNRITDQLTSQSTKASNRVTHLTQAVQRVSTARPGGDGHQDQTSALRRRHLVTPPHDGRHSATSQRGLFAVVSTDRNL